MNRRILLASLAAFPFATRAQAAGDWQARLVLGTFDGSVYQAGLHLLLAEGWKTYWRVPGEAGIPPQITVTGSNLESAEVEYPLPTRIVDESGESLGYHKEVLFPLSLKPKDSAQPVEAKVSAFFGICEQICKPAKFADALMLAPASGQTNEQQLIQLWRDQVPKQADFADAAMIEGKELVLQLRQPVDDIFVEGPDGLYFRKPQFANDKARLVIDGLKDDIPTKGMALRLTAAMQGQGLEQALTLA
jgi:DsbC/DsbD-like thiol-disulfide interchange protein